MERFDIRMFTSAWGKRYQDSIRGCYMPALGAWNPMTGWVPSSEKRLHVEGQHINPAPIVMVISQRVRDMDVVLTISYSTAKLSSWETQFYNGRSYQYPVYEHDQTKTVKVIVPAFTDPETIFRICEDDNMIYDVLDVSGGDCRYDEIFTIIALASPTAKLLYAQNWHQLYENMLKVKKSIFAAPSLCVTCRGTGTVQYAMEKKVNKLCTFNYPDGTLIENMENWVASSGDKTNGTTTICEIRGMRIYGLGTYDISGDFDINKGYYLPQKATEDGSQFFFTIDMIKAGEYYQSRSVDIGLIGGSALAITLLNYIRFKAQTDGVSERDMSDPPIMFTIWPLGGYGFVAMEDDLVTPIDVKGIHSYRVDLNFTDQTMQCYILQDDLSWKLVTFYYDPLEMYGSVIPFNSFFGASTDFAYVFLGTHAYPVEFYLNEMSCNWGSLIVAGDTCPECGGWGFSGSNAVGYDLDRLGRQFGVTREYSTESDERYRKRIWARRWWLVPTKDEITRYFKHFCHVSDDNISVFEMKRPHDPTFFVCVDPNYMGLGAIWQPGDDFENYDELVERACPAGVNGYFAWLGSSDEAVACDDVVDETTNATWMRSHADILGSVIGSANLGEFYFDGWEAPMMPPNMLDDFEPYTQDDDIATENPTKWTLVSGSFEADE